MDKKEKNQANKHIIITIIAILAIFVTYNVCISPYVQKIVNQNKCDTYYNSEKHEGNRYRATKFESGIWACCNDYKDIRSCGAAW